MHTCTRSRSPRCCCCCCHSPCAEPKSRQRAPDPRARTSEWKGLLGGGGGLGGFGGGGDEGGRRQDSGDLLDVWFERKGSGGGKGDKKGADKRRR